MTAVVSAAVIGYAALTATQAATFTWHGEAETGTAGAPAAAYADGAASGGSAVRFKAGTPPGPGPIPSETSFTVAAIPDTQVEVSSAANYPRFTNRLQWLADNKNTLNLKYVWQVGDLQDWDDETHSHYERASTGLRLLEQAGIPYALTVGNHDTAAVCYGGSACPGKDIPTEFRNIATWHRYYPPSRFAGIKTMCQEFSTFNDRLMAAGPAGTGLHTPTYMRTQCQTADTTDNAYRTFTAGGLKWLLINYEMWPRQAAQEWMKTVIERHMDHNVILFTHMHLNGGTTNLPTDFGGYGSPQGSPKAVYDNVISQYPNVRITSNGHTGGSGCAVFDGPKGNRIYSYVNDRLSSSPTPNQLRLLKIDTAANTLTSQVYVPQSGETMGQAANCNASGVNWVR